MDKQWMDTNKRWTTFVQKISVFILSERCQVTIFHSYLFWSILNQPSLNRSDAAAGWVQPDSRLSRRALLGYMVGANTAECEKKILTVC